MAIGFGIISTIISTFLFAANFIIVYVGLEEVGAESFVAVRYTFLAMIALPELLKNPIHLQMGIKSWLLIVIAGIFFGVMSLTSFSALAYMPPLDETCLFNFQAVIMLFIGCAFLKEKITIYEVIMVLLITGGVIFVCQPEFIFGKDSNVKETDQLLGLSLGIGSAIASSIGMSILRYSNEIPLCVINYVTGITSAIMVFLATGRNLKSPSTFSGYATLISSGMLGATGRSFLQFALKKEPATLVAAVLPLELVNIAILQVPLLNIMPNILKLFGAILIVMSLVLLSTKDYILKFSNYLRYRSNLAECNETRELIVQTN